MIVALGGTLLAPGTCRAQGPSAHAYLIMDARTGWVLSEHNGFERRPPASTTKILTALVVIERGRLGRVVTVSPRAAATPGSSAHLRAHGRYRVLDLLRGLLLPSGNDAAVALAEAADGSVSAFVRRMNRRARELGAVASHFVNPHGLTAPGHVTTAYDLAVLTRAALRHPLFRELVTTRSADFGEVGGPVRRLYNSNRLLATYPGVLGVKTGTTSAAGRCLVAAARRGELTLIGVVLDDPDRFADMARLFDRGFREFARVRRRPAAVRVRVRDGERPWVPVVAARELDAPVPRAQADGVRLRVWVPRQLLAPVRRHEVVGTAALVAGTQVLDRTVLRTQAAVPVDRSLSAALRRGLSLLATIWRIAHP